jgi:hypothetical protein
MASAMLFQCCAISEMVGAILDFSSEAHSKISTIPCSAPLRDGAIRHETVPAQGRNVLSEEPAGLLLAGLRSI